MASNNKKNEELFYLEKFLDFIEINAINIIPGESPDFILELSNKIVGVELTEYHLELNKPKGQTRRAMEERWKNIQDHLYEKIKLIKKLSGVKCEIFFRDIYTLPRKAEIPDFINELFKYVIFKLNNQFISLDSIPISEKYKLLNKYIKEVKLYNYNSGIFHRWDSNLRIGSIGMTEEGLLNIIEPKIIKSEKYMNKEFNELWLLVIFGYRISQTIPPRLENYIDDFNKLNERLKQSKFDYVFLYLYMFDVVYQYPEWIKHSKGKF